MHLAKKLFQWIQKSLLLYGIAILCVIGAQISALIMPIIIRYAIDTVLGGQTSSEIWLPAFAQNSLMGICILIIILSLFRSIFLFVKGYMAAWASENTAKSFKDALMEKIQEVHFSFYAKHDTGDLIQRATSDVETIRRFLATQFVEVINILLMVGLTAYLMYRLHPKLTLVALSLMPAVIFFSFWFFFRVKKKFKITDEAEGKLTAVLQENIAGIKVVKAFGREPYEAEKFDRENQRYAQSIRNLVYNFAYFWSSSDALCFTQIALVMIFGSLWVIEGRMTVGTLVAFITYEGMLVFPIRTLGRILSEFGKAMVSAERIFEILEAPNDDSEDGVMSPEIQGQIQFEGVSFSYEEGQAALHNVSFQIKKGETIGILGPTGAGKSTLAYLMTRFFEPSQGKILIDGIDIKKMKKKHLRKNIGLILQDNFLYAKPIKENIAIRHHEATEAEIIRASEIAALHQSVQQFDGRYDTVVGEKGVSLSGGQRQRVAIARNVIRPSKITIFDDSLSALDTETDAMIRKALKDNFKENTTLIISHRIETLAETDRVLVLEKGQVTDFDSPEILARKDGLYRRICDIQQMES